MKKSVDFSFDFASPAVVPKAIEPALSSHGIGSGEIVLLARADLDRSRGFADCYVFLTPRALCVLSGLTNGGENGVFLEKDYEETPLEGLTGMRVEDLASSSYLSVKRDGEKRFVACFSRGFREDFVQFSAYANEYFEKKTVTPEKDAKNAKSERFCPTCGMRYADSEAKICPKCRKRSGVIRRTFSLFGEYRVKIVLVITALMVGAGLAVITPYLSAGFLYDKVLADKDNYFYGKIGLAIAAIVLTRVLSMGVSSVHSILTSRLAADMTYKLKKVIFSSINRLSLSFFTSRKTGGLMTQVDGDAQTIYWFFCDELPQFLVEGVQVIAVSVIMFLINPLLALAAVILLPVSFLVVKKIFARLDVLHGRNFARRRSLSSALSDMLGGVRVVKAFSGEDLERKRFSAKSEALGQSDRAVGRFNARSFPFVTLLLRLGSVLVWAAGGVMILVNFRSPGVISPNAFLTYGMLATFLSYVSMVYEPMFNFAGTLSMAADSMNAMGRLIEIMDARPDVTEDENAVDPGEMKGEVCFENVSFSYIPGVPVLENVSFDVKAGEMLGIVGRTGAGKSTLMNLLIRMYDPEKGRILIDGVDLRKLRFDFLRRNVSIVSQDTYLFSGTVLENVRYARPEATLEEVVDACVAAGANDFIMKLRDGYDTRIGQGYEDLSGGERQRLSIARAILKKPKILILDEATASMDTRTEQTVQQALAEFSVGRTTLSIAHRLSTLKDADRLIVIDDKSVAEEGTPRELIKKRGVYYGLYKLQVEALRNVGITEENW